MNKDALAKSLFMVERAIMTNNYETLQFVYRGLDFKDDNADISEHNLRIPSVKFLWSFRCEATKGRVVTCMTWNRHNKVSFLSSHFAGYFGRWFLK